MKRTIQQHTQSVCHLDGLVMNKRDASKTAYSFFVTPGSDSDPTILRIQGYMDTAGKAEVAKKAISVI
jgi:hypothetical protein